MRLKLLHENKSQYDECPFCGNPFATVAGDEIACIDEKCENFNKEYRDIVYDDGIRLTGLPVKVTHKVWDKEAGRNCDMDSVYTVSLPHHNAPWSIFREEFPSRKQRRARKTYRRVKVDHGHAMLAEVISKMLGETTRGLLKVSGRDVYLDIDGQRVKLS